MLRARGGRPPAGSSSIGPRLATLGISLLATTLALPGCHRATPAAPEPPPPEVTVARPILRKMVDYWEYTGRLEATDQVEIRARVRGFLQKVHFKEGAEVKAGDLLYEIDPRTFQADVAKAQADVKRQETQLNLAAIEAARSQQLITRQVASPEEYQQRAAARESARAALQQAQAALQSAQLELEFTKIRAPISGRISRTRVTEGNLVGSGEPTLLTTIVSMDPIYVYFEATEREFLDYQQMIRERGVPKAEQAKIPISVGLANEEGLPHEGVIDFRDNRVDLGTGTVELRGSLPNRDRTLIPGLFARVRVPIGAPRPHLLVPEVALSADQRGPFVLVVAPDGTVRARTVRAGPAQEGGLVVIESGLSAGDSIVVNGLQRARPGTKVRAVTGAVAANPTSPGGGATPRTDQAPPTAPAIGQPPATPRAGNAPNS